MDPGRLFDIVVEENVVPDEYFLGWDTYAEWQFEALRRLGLSPSSYLLDVGCGALRLGSLAIPFLEPGHYCGIDPYEPLLRAGNRIIAELGIEKPYATLLSGDFNFADFKLTFDYAIAQSVFTHMSQAQIDECVRNLVTVMAPGGVLLFTYTLLPPDARRGLLFSGLSPMRVPVIESTTFFEDLAAKHGVRFETPAQLEHPTQSCGLLRFG